MILDDYTIKKVSDSKYYIYKIPTIIYVVEFAKKSTCTCPSYVYCGDRPKTCKHLDFIKHMIDTKNAL